VFAAADLLLAAVVAVAVAAAVGAAASVALEPVTAAAGPPESLVRCLRLSTQAILLCLSSLCLRTFDQRLAVFLVAGRRLRGGLVDRGGVGWPAGMIEELHPTARLKKPSCTNPAQRRTPDIALACGRRLDPGGSGGGS
jgi:hypothetical protein